MSFPNDYTQRPGFHPAIRYRTPPTLLPLTPNPIRDRITGESLQDIWRESQGLVARPTTPVYPSPVYPSQPPSHPVVGVPGAVGGLGGFPGDVYTEEDPLLISTPFGEYNLRDASISAEGSIPWPVHWGPGHAAKAIPWAPGGSGSLGDLAQRAGTAVGDFFLGTVPEFVSNIPGYISSAPGEIWDLIQNAPENIWDYATSGSPPGGYALSDPGFTARTAYGPGSIGMHPFGPGSIIGPQHSGLQTDSFAGNRFLDWSTFSQIIPDPTEDKYMAYLDFLVEEKPHALEPYLWYLVNWNAVDLNDAERIVNASNDFYSDPNGYIYQTLRDGAGGHDDFDLYLPHGQWGTGGLQPIGFEFGAPAGEEWVQDSTDGHMYRNISVNDISEPEGYGSSVETVPPVQTTPVQQPAVEEQPGITGVYNPYFESHPYLTDLNQSGDINTQDFALYSQGYGDMKAANEALVGQPGYNPYFDAYPDLTDLNQDDLINTQDFAIYSQNYGDAMRENEELRPPGYHRGGIVDAGRGLRAPEWWDEYTWSPEDFTWNRAEGFEGPPFYQGRFRPPFYHMGEPGSYEYAKNISDQSRGVGSTPQVYNPYYDTYPDMVDFNNDGRINTQDFARYSQNYGDAINEGVYETNPYFDTHPGMFDTDHSGQVNAQDFAHYSRYWNEQRDANDRLGELTEDYQDYQDWLESDAGGGLYPEYETPPDRYPEYESPPWNPNPSPQMPTATYQSGGFVRPMQGNMGIPPMGQQAQHPGPQMPKQPEIFGSNLPNPNIKKGIMGTVMPQNKPMSPKGYAQEMGARKNLSSRYPRQQQGTMIRPDQNVGGIAGLQQQQQPAGLSGKGSSWLEELWDGPLKNTASPLSGFKRGGPVGGSAKARMIRRRGGGGQPSSAKAAYDNAMAMIKGGLGSAESPVPLAREAIETHRFHPADPMMQSTEVFESQGGRHDLAPFIQETVSTGDKWDDPLHRQAMMDIRRHEGERFMPYEDSTGNMTIGVGHKILPGEDYSAGISREESDAKFQEDYRRHAIAAERVPGFAMANEAQKRAFINLTYNMGPNWHEKWPKFSKAAGSGDFETAGAELIDSDWYGQVGSRAPEIVSMVRGYAGGGQVSMDEANQMVASQGRHGDTALLHVNPAELKGLETLLGPMTTNPETGNPEAFALTATLIGMAIGAAAGGLGSYFSNPGAGWQDHLIATGIGAAGGAAGGALGGLASGPAAGTAASTATAGAQSAAPSVFTSSLSALAPETIGAATSGALGTATSSAAPAAAAAAAPSAGKIAAGMIGGVAPDLLGRGASYAMDRFGGSSGGGGGRRKSRGISGPLASHARTQGDSPFKTTGQGIGPKGSLASLGKLGPKRSLIG